MSLIIYIAEKLFRTAHADVFLLEHHQKVCVSTICREKHVLKILSCADRKKKKKTNMLQRISVLSWSYETINIRVFLKIII